MLRLPRRAAAAAFTAVSALSTVSAAQAGVIFDLPSFAGACAGGAGMSCIGSATTVGDVLQLTPPTPYVAGAAYSTTAVTLGGGATFSTEFQFRISNAGGIAPADGLTFIVSHSSSGLGAPGGSLGYEGVSNSVAIEFDMFDNGESDGYSSNGVSVRTNSGAGSARSVLTSRGTGSSAQANPYGVVTCDFGSVAPETRSVPTYSLPGCMSNGDVWTANIVYDGRLLDVYLRDGAMAREHLIASHAIDLSALLGTDQAYVGFTAATGDGWSQHDILNWRFANDVSVTPNVVPEPGSLALVGVAALGGLLARRRRQD